ncbi:hypothetical protein [Cognatishimia sp. MH4019]|uniref:hypothetical protein n=1 Tax=Cognatishimia sp. MH4019 TaxID=2854030 RepID=UPI001CD466F2|nr:hypothetical protein [Cognatishimia sp. MH4019]
MKKSLSASRFQRYLADSDGNDGKALSLYQHNSRLCQSLYIYTQAWEICLRNKIDEFLRTKYGDRWFENQGAIRNFKKHDRRSLDTTVSRQKRERNSTRLKADVVVADLSAGFWVSQLSVDYEAHYRWANGVGAIFPNDFSLDRQAAWEICDRSRRLRNRIAHHEPIYHFDLNAHYRDLQRITAAMCKGTFLFANQNCTFREVHDGWPAE